MIALSCDNISLSFGVEVILDKISFSINEGDKLGIVGVNGAGKSSLFKIITGEYTADSGDIYISKDKTVGVLDQYIGFESENTLLAEMENSFPNLLADEERIALLHEQIEYNALSGKVDNALIDSYTSLTEKFARDGGYEFRSRCKGILKNLGFDENFWYNRISSLSGGQKTRLALARLLLREPDILMLDEPTNHLDIDALFWLESFLKNYRKTVLVVSHDRYFLDAVTNKILDVENHHAKLYGGNYTRFMELKSADREIQERHYKNQQAEIARIEAYIEQQRRWNRERNIIAAESRQKLLDKMERVERPESTPAAIRLRFNKSGESGNDVLTVKHLCKSYPGKTLFYDVNFLIKKKEHVFITGQNGCGKSTLIKMLAEKTEPDSGSVEYGYNVTVGYYDQENQNLDDSKTVIDELWDSYPWMVQTDIRNALALFLFRGDDIQKPVSILSGGERARLTLCKLILAKMNVLILDEPTNHLDIKSREALESALEEFDGTIIAVSHDRYFINKLSTRILDFNAVENARIFDYRGGYNEYIAYKNNMLMKSDEGDTENNVSASKEQYLSTKKALAEKRRAEAKLRRTEEEITRLEGEIADIDAEMSGDAASNHERLQELYSLREQKDTRLNELYAELEQLF